METIYFFAEGVAFELPDAAATASWLQAVIRQEDYGLEGLNVIFCCDAYLHAHNVRYLQQDALTDVLAFDYADTAEVLEGDVYISIDRVRANTSAGQQPWLRELHTVLVHGVLHLMGYRDHTPAAKGLMRRKEAAYVAQCTAAAFLQKEKE